MGNGWRGVGLPMADGWRGVGLQSHDGGVSDGEGWGFNFPKMF